MLDRGCSILPRDKAWIWHKCRIPTPLPLSDQPPATHFPSAPKHLLPTSLSLPLPSHTPMLVSFRQHTLLPSKVHDSVERPLQFPASDSPFLWMFQTCFKEHLPHPWVGTRNFFAQMGAQDCVSSVSCNPHPIAMPLCVGLGTCLGLICNRCLWKLRRHDSATAGDGICTAKGETSGKMKTSVGFHIEIKIKKFMASLPMQPLEPVRKLLYILNIDAADQS